MKGTALSGGFKMLIDQEEKEKFFKRNDLRIILVKLRKGINLNADEYQLCKKNSIYFKDFVFIRSRLAKTSAFRSIALIKN